MSMICTWVFNEARIIQMNGKTMPSASTMRLR
jgi:hypothetical protein